MQGHQSTKLRYQATWIILIQYGPAFSALVGGCAHFDKLMLSNKTVTNIAEHLHVHVTCGRIPGNVTW